jgi:N-acetylglucosamine kinase-like BadF-type ATPase
MLRAVYRAELGLEPPTSLTQRALKFFGLTQVEEVLHLLTARNHEQSASYLGKLARALLDEARHGDAVAQRIVEEHGADLAAYGLVAARKVGLEDAPFNLILAGSVLRRGGPLSRAIRNHMWKTAPKIQLTHSGIEPVVGALFLALESLDIPIDQGLRARTGGSMPPFSLFET